MSKQSEAVKKWRHNCKKRIINAMGGKCCICGYKKCQSALALHHLDPSQKDVGIGFTRANPKNWEMIVNELRKCVLICHVCHCEVHENIVQIPLDAPKFDESFADYKKLRADKKIFTPCPICNKMKALHLRNCSLKCANKSRRKIDWDNVNLKEELKTKSVLALAKQLGCSDVAIHKKLRKLDLK